jgi:hypothetical protein
MISRNVHTEAVPDRASRRIHVPVAIAMVPLEQRDNSRDRIYTGGPTELGETAKMNRRDAS